MNEFIPFRGLRYADRDALDRLIAPPYDVISPAQRVALASRDPRNSVNLILPDGYDTAATDLAEWRASGTLVLDDAPTFTVYRMTFDDGKGNLRRTLGVIGALALPEQDTGDVLPHERTIPKHRDDRLRLLRATRANTDPIWLCSLAEGLTERLKDALVRPPSLVATDDDGVLHQTWVIDDPKFTSAVSELVGAQPLVLADGHHRYQTARMYRHELGAAGQRIPGADRIMACIVELHPDQLWVRPTHRLISGLRDFDLRSALSGNFDLLAPDENGDGLTLIDGQGEASLVPTAALEDFVRVTEPDPVAATDAARYEHGVTPVLPASAEVRYPADEATATEEVFRGTADAAVLLRPVTVDQIRAAAFADVRFPQKTTYFAPKLQTGMVFRSLVD